MRVEVKKELTFILILNEDEAKSLKKLVQNTMSKDESNFDYVVRYEIWNCLSEIKLEGE